MGTCLPFLLEADVEVELSAQRAQRDLAQAGYHRLSPVDLIVVACAAQAQGGVFHYDRDYDLILEHTSLHFESIWLAEPGTLP